MSGVRNYHVGGPSWTEGHLVKIDRWSKHYALTFVAVWFQREVPERVHGPYVKSPAPHPSPPPPKHKFEDEGPHDSQTSLNLSDPRHGPGHCDPSGMWRPTSWPAGDLAGCWGW